MSEVYSMVWKGSLTVTRWVTGTYVAKSVKVLIFDVFQSYQPRNFLRKNGSDEKWPTPIDS